MTYLKAFIAGFGSTLVFHLEKFFTGRYERLLLKGVGHFPHRESPIKVAQAVIRHFQSVE